MGKSFIDFNKVNTERLFKNTPLLELYPEILDLVDDTTYRNIWKKAKKELKLSPEIGRAHV